MYNDEWMKEWLCCVVYPEKSQESRIEAQNIPAPLIIFNQKNNFQINHTIMMLLKQ